MKKSNIYKLQINIIFKFLNILKLNISHKISQDFNEALIGVIG